MPETKYTVLLENIIQRTKERQLHWQYLDSDADLYKNMGWETDSYPLGMLVSGGSRPNFDTEESFYTSDKGYKIVLLVRGNSPARFFVIPSTYKRVLQLNAAEYGEHITRLLNLVRSQFPDAEDYVNRILEETTIDDHIQDK